jgi:hypothetical protein
MLHEKARHEAGGVPSTGDQAAKGAAFGRLGICMQRLRVKLFGEGDYLIRPDHDSAKAVHIAFNIILEVPIGDRTQKWHSGIHCQNARLSRAKPIGAAKTILGVMSALGQKRTWRSEVVMSRTFGSATQEVRNQERAAATMKRKRGDVVISMKRTHDAPDV